jgi:hypothetical protein
MALADFISASWQVLGPFVPMWAVAIIVSYTLQSIFAGLIILAMSQT